MGADMHLERSQTNIVLLAELTTELLSNLRDTMELLVLREPGESSIALIASLALVARRVHCPPRWGWRWLLLTSAVPELFQSQEAHWVTTFNLTFTPSGEVISLASTMIMLMMSSAPGWLLE